jgi:hypothetical protein
MSLPEVLLVLREDARREAGRALVALQTQALAAFAVWDREAGRRLEQFKRSLGDSLLPAKAPDTQELGRIIGGWGVEQD